MCVCEREKERDFYFFFFWGGREKITHCAVKSLSAADRRNGASPRATNPRFPPLPQCLAARTGKVKVVKPPLSLSLSLMAWLPSTRTIKGLTTTSVHVLPHTQHTTTSAHVLPHTQLTRTHVFTHGRYLALPASH